LSVAKLVTSLLTDSKSFQFLARDASRKGQNELALSYSRAIFFCSWSAMEGWVNYIAYSFAKTDNTLTKYEKAFLIEKKIEVDNNGDVRITNQDDYKPTMKKLIFVMKKYGNYNLKTGQPTVWSDLKNMERKRHSIVHPKTRNEEFNLELTDAEKCCETILQVINLLKEKVYGN
jgi:hypothetical protein